MFFLIIRYYFNNKPNEHRVYYSFQILNQKRQLRFYAKKETIKRTIFYKKATLKGNQIAYRATGATSCPTNSPAKYL